VSAPADGSEWLMYDKCVGCCDLTCRWNRSTNSISARRLRIAMLCGQKEDLQGVELWEHDVIVVTAGNCVLDIILCCLYL